MYQLGLYHFSPERQAVPVFYPTGHTAHRDLFLTQLSDYHPMSYPKELIPAQQAVRRIFPHLEFSLPTHDGA